jgi:hypothetical protein
MLADTRITANTRRARLGVRPDVSADWCVIAVPPSLMGRIGLAQRPAWLPARHVIPRARPYAGPTELATLYAHDPLR